MLKRLLSAAVVLPFFVWAMFRTTLGFRLFMCACILLAFEEYRRMMVQRRYGFEPWLGLIVLAALLLPAAFAGEEWPAKVFAWQGGRASGLALTGAFLVAALWRVYRPDPDYGLKRFLAELGGLFYLGLLGLHLLKLHALPDGAWWTFLVFWYAWIYDSAALFVGRSLGRHRFNPLSPGKTWEGFWGGLLLNALLSALLLPIFFPVGFPLGAWGFAALSVPASVLGQGGDLFESMLKRFAGVKDSSALIPSQGGFLDKMDSSLFVAPLVYLAATFLVP